MDNVFFGGAIQLRDGFFKIGEGRLAAHNFDSVFISFSDQIVDIGFTLVDPEFFDGGFGDGHGGYCIRLECA